MSLSQQTLSSSNALRHYSFLFQAAQALNATLEVDEVLQQLMALTQQHFQPEAISIALVDSEGTLHFKAAAGGGTLSLIGLRLPAGTGIIGWVAEHGQSLWVPDVQQDPRWYGGVDEQTGFVTRAIYAAPVLHHHRTVAIVEMINPAEDMEQVEYATVMKALTNLAASAIRNAQLFEQVSRAEKRYEALFESNIDPIVILDHTGRLIELNPAARELLDCNEDDDPDSCLEELGLSPESFAQIRQHLITHKSYRMEAPITHKNLDQVLEVSIIRLTGHEPEDIYQWIGHDITDRVALEEMREQLSHMIVHDLRNPLGSIISSVNLVRTAWEEKDMTMPILHVLRIASRNAERMERLIDNILDTARLRSGDGRLTRETIDVCQIVEEVIEIVRPALNHRRQQLYDHCPSTIAPLQGDADLIQRVLINLLDNASKFSPSQSTIHLYVDEEPDAICFRVRDNGPGVPEKEQERIFELYVRGTEGPRTSGAGIGLTFCKLAVEAHGGRIWMQNNPEGGATFTVNLPKHSAPDAILF